MSTDTTTLPGPCYDLRLVGHLAEHLFWMRLAGRADATLLARRRAIVWLAEYLGHDPETACYDELERYQRHCLRTSRNHVRAQTSLIRPYYGWLHERGIRADNPAARLPCPKRPRGVPRPMAEDKLDAMLAGAAGRLLAWLLLAGWCGLRCCEIAGLRVEDFVVGASGQVRVVVRGKGDVVREVPVPAPIWVEVAAVLPERGAAWRRLRGFGPVLASHVSQAANDYLHEVCDIPDTFHSLRHRFATLAYRTCRDVFLVQDLCGHASPQTTRGYTRVDSEEMAAVVNALPPPRLPGRRAHLHVVDDTAQGGPA